MAKCRVPSPDFNFSTTVSLCREFLDGVGSDEDAGTGAIFRCNWSLMFNSWSLFFTRSATAFKIGSGIWQCMLTARPSAKCSWLVWNRELASGSSGIREFQINNGFVRLFKQHLSTLNLMSMPMKINYMTACMGEGRQQIWRSSLE